MKDCRNETVRSKLLEIANAGQSVAVKMDPSEASTAASKPVSSLFTHERRRTFVTSFTFVLLLIGIILHLHNKVAIQNIVWRYADLQRDLQNGMKRDWFYRYRQLVNPRSLDYVPLCPSRDPLVQDEKLLLTRLPSIAEKKRVASAKIHFVTYVDPQVHKLPTTVQEITKAVRKSGRFASLHIYTPRNLSSVFKGYFESVLKYPRSSIFGLWKPYVIRDALERFVNTGDYMMFVDAAAKQINTGGRFEDYLIMLERSKYSVLGVYSSKHVNESAYSSGRTLETLGVMYSDSILKSRQISSKFFLIRKQPRIHELLDKFLRVLYADKLIITNRYGRYRVRSDFVAHTYDQAIFSLLLKCSGVVAVDENTSKKDSAVVI